MLFATRLSAGHGGPSSMSSFLNTSSSKNETFFFVFFNKLRSYHVFAPLRGFNSTGPSSQNSVTLLGLRSKRNSLSLISRFKPSRLTTVSGSNSSESTSSGAESAGRISSSEAAAGSDEAVAGAKDEVSEGGKFHVEVRNPSLSIPSTAKLSLSDRAFFLLAFIACTTSVAFTSLVVAAVPTLCAMGRAATSLSKLADTACEELPSTMAAIRL